MATSPPTWASLTAVMYVRISPHLTCAAQTQRCAEHIEAAPADPQRLLDAIRCGHLALMAALTTALSGTAGVGAFPDKLAGEHLEYMRGLRPDMPGEFTLSLSQLFRRVQEPDRLDFSKPLEFTDNEKRAVAEIDRFRTQIDHPKPTHWSVEITLIVQLLEFLPNLLEKCIGAAGHRYLDGPDAALANGIARIRAGLDQMPREVA